LPVADGGEGGAVMVADNNGLGMGVVGVA